MSDTAATPSRKGRVLWTLAGLFLLIAAWFFYQLFGPSSAIVISKATTFVTEPLREDGLPDYKAYWLKQNSQGVTSKNNAAVLLWQAMWPGELPQELWLEMCNALGMEKVPSERDSLTPVYSQTLRQQIAIELAARFAKQTAENAIDEETSQLWQKQLENTTADELIGEAAQRPWTSEQSPALAQWVADNQKPLDLLVEAAARPQYFSPSPTLIDGSDDMLLALMLPHIQMMRTTTRALPVRAMWHLGAGRTAEAWQDLLACHRLARLTAKSNTIVSQLVAIAMDGVACHVTHVLLQHPNLDKQLAKQILADLNQLSATSSMAKAIDQGERLLFLDTVMTLATGKQTIAELQSLFGSAEPLVIILSGKVDWNLILRNGNRWHDQLVAAARQPTHQQRTLASDRINEKLRQLTDRTQKPSAWIGSVLSEKQRSEMACNLLMGMFLPGAQSAFGAEDRSNTELELTRVAAALAVYRIENGTYPEQLDELVPAVLTQLPIDLFSGKPFLYQRKEDGGFLLYSIFKNKIDDQGTGRGGKVIAGEWVDETPDSYDYQESDLVIRVPMPAFKFPEPPDDDDFGYGF